MFWRRKRKEESIRKDTRGYGQLYDTKKRLASYWHQIDETRQAEPKKVLEIGVGSRFVSRYLADYYDLTTLDTSIELQPTVVGSVLSLPFKDNDFDVVLCCQVLEHLPFSSFGTALSELFRVSAKRVVLSLPDKRPFRPIQLPRIGRYKLYNPFFKPAKHVFDGVHHWEVNAIGTELEKVLEIIQTIGFRVLRDYQVFENYHHHFFILERA